MHIIYFHQHFSTPEGSAGTRSFEMAKGLIRNGHTVTMVCGSCHAGKTGLNEGFVNKKRAGKVEGINIIEFDLAYSNSDGLAKRAITFLKFAIKSIGIALTSKYDVLFATSTPLTAGIPGIFARWLRGKTFVFEVRDLWPELPKEMGVIKNPIILSALSLLEWISYRSAHRCIGLSPGIVQGINRRGVASEKITLIPNGCDLELFTSDVEPWHIEGVSKNDLVAVFTGTHGQANGLSALLDAAAELKRRNRSDIKLVLVGQGKLKAALEQRAKIENLDNVIFHEAVSKLKLTELMKGADVGMQLLANVPAFYYGTSPNKFFDYISAGLPVLNNYPGWLAELIHTHQCGFAVQPDDAEAFADALEVAANNRGDLSAMGDRARLLAQNEFDRLKLANKWVNWVTKGIS